MWLAERVSWSSAAFFDEDLSWRRLADAPFSPRSDVQVRSYLQVYANTTMYVMGGQTGHACGLYELGICSDEAWELHLVPPSQPEGGEWHTGVSWRALSPTFRLPSPPRCEPAVFSVSARGVDRHDLPIVNLDYVLVNSGQLSYSPNSSDWDCSAPPVTVGERWAAWLNFTVDGRVEATEWFRHVDHSTQTFPRRFRRVNQRSEVAIGLKDFSDDGAVQFAGGVRHVAVRETSPGQAQLQSTELYADVLNCWPRNETGQYGENVYCDWWLTRRTLPAPTDGGVLHLADALRVHELTFGGRTSSAFTRLWEATLPWHDDSDIIWDMAELGFNISLVRERNDRWRDRDALHEWRGGLPFDVMLGEEELNDPNSDWQLGDQGMTGQAMHPSTLANTNGHIATWHKQLTAFSDRPPSFDSNSSSAAAAASSAWFVPQAASSMNSSRPLHNFSLRRHSHASATLWQSLRAAGMWPISYLPSTFTSGGRSGQRFFRDWITTHGSSCLPFSDPSWTTVLGPMRVLGTETRAGTPSLAYAYSWGSFWSPWEVIVSCEPGSHFSPPTTDSKVTLMCAPNGMYVDPTVLTVRRCVADRLSCAFPLVDLGGLYCNPMPPLLQQLRASYGVGRTRHPVTNADAVTLIDVPPVGGVELLIIGSRPFFHPVVVTVQGQPCSDVQLLPEAGQDVLPVACYNISDSRDSGEPVWVCSTYSRQVTCLLPALLGRGMALAVRSGWLSEVAEVDPTVSETALETASLSSMAPVVTRIHGDGSGDCEQVDALHLEGCSVTRPFALTLCASSESLGSPLADLMVLDSGDAGRPLQCTEARPGGQFPSGPEADEGSERCLSCSVRPHLGRIRLWLSHLSVGLSSSQDVSIDFQQCPAGTRTDYRAALSGDGDLCVECPAGWSTNNAAGASECNPCPAGYYSNVTGAETCWSCPVGSFANSANSTSCSPCSLNSYANSTAHTRCEACELNHYIVYATSSAAGIAGECHDCPDLATCYADGSIAAHTGGYLLIDQAAGTVSTALCSPSACVDFDYAGNAALQPVTTSSSSSSSSSLSSAPSSAQYISKSQLPVLNQCAQGRWPAVTSDGSAYGGDERLSSTDGVNVLCASCLPKYSQVNGRCIPCSSTNYGALLLVVLLALFLVYLIHRLPHDFSGSATLLIGSNFLQLSSLFLASESVPQIISLVNVNLLGDHSSRGQQADGGSAGGAGYVGYCVVPLTDEGRIAMQLLSPLVACGLLGAVWLLQLLLRAAMLRGSPSPRRVALYRWLCVPRQPLLGPAGLDGAPNDFQGSTGSQSLLSSAQEAQAAGDEKECGVMSTSHPPSSGEPVPSHCLRLAYQRSAVRLLQLSYVSLTVLTLSFFQLTSVGEYGHRLSDFPALSPDSSAYQQLLPVICLLLALLVCGLPVLLAAWLLFEHRAGGIAAVKAHQQQRAAGERHLVPVPLSARSALLLQLTAMFRPGCWWMASFALVRRLVLILLLTVIRSEAVWGWLTLCNYLSLTVHMLLQPYERARDNSLETLCFLSITVQTTLLSIYPPPYMSPALIAAFNALVIGPMLPLLLTVSSRAWSKYRGYRFAEQSSF